MNGLFSNKFFILFLILTVSLYSFSVKIAQAGKGFFTILSVVLMVVAIVFQQYWVPEMLTTYVFPGGYMTTATAMFGTGAILAGGTILTGAAACAEGLICAGGGSSGGIPTIVSSEAGGCRYQIPLTFYIPAYGQGWQEKLYYYDNDGNRVELPSGTQRYRPCNFRWFGWSFNKEQPENNIYDCGTEDTPNNCAVPDSNGSYALITNPNPWGGNPQQQCVNVTTSCESGSAGEGNQIALYRFTLPITASQETLNNWFMNSIKNQVGNGFTSIGSGFGGNSSYWTSSDSGPFSTVSASQICSGNTCRINDSTAPEDSYVVYGAKILGNYASREEVPGPGDSTSYVCNSKPNKFLNTDNSSSVQFPFINTGDKKEGPSWGTGNAFLGPYKTQKAECPAEAVADVKLTTLGCKSVAVTVKVNDVSQYSGFDVYANDKFVGSQNIITKETVYTIPNLSRKSTNNFKISVKRKDNLIQDFLLNSITTVCPPECRITANPDKLVFPKGETQLSWNCLDENNNSTADSCSIFSTILPLNYSNFSNFCSSGLKGSMTKIKMENMTEEQESCSVVTTKSSAQISLDKPATFFLSCKNQDGSSLNSAFVDFLRPVYQEITPR